MARKTKGKRADKRKTKAAPAPSEDSGNPFKLRPPSAIANTADPRTHIIRPGVRCDTEKRGYPMPEGRSPLEIVVDASEGFVPLWAKDTTLHWRFRESSLRAFEKPEKAKAAIGKLLGKAIIAWKDAAPVKFARREDTWDFEIVMERGDDCDINGCVLASAFFPDAGRHKLKLYPKMFEQSEQEQIETMVHEIGHIFGLRHFFALVSETRWPAIVFGTHQKFSIMNYGTDSRLTDADRSDLKKLYQMAWAGQIKEINGTPIKFVKPYHTNRETAQEVASIIAA